MNGIDVSFSRVSPAWCQHRVAEGVRVFVQCLWTGGYQAHPGIRAVAEANLKDAREAGMITAGYLNTNPWFPANISLIEAERNANTEWDRIGENAPGWHPFAGGVVFNDVEISGVTEAQIKEHCEAITGAGKKTAIYSARWFWTGHLGNAQWPWLLDYDIWAADYDHDPDIASAALFGPWSKADVIGKQYEGTVDVEGVDIDRNIFDLAFFGDSGTGQEDDMTGYDKAIIDAVATLTDGEYVSDGYAIYYVERKGDVPTLKRVDDSRASIITGFRSVPLGVSMLLFHGEQVA